MKWYQFDPGKGFFELTITRVVFFAGLVLFALFGAGYIWAASDLQCCFKPECLNYFFVELMKVPLGTLAFTAAGLALMATHHRSKQFASQSNISNYFTHLKEFRAYMAEWDQGQIQIKSASGFYKQFFPGTLRGDIHACPRTLKILVGEFQRVCDQLDLILGLKGATGEDYVKQIKLATLFASSSYSMLNSHIEKYNGADPPEIDMGNIPINAEDLSNFKKELNRLRLAIKLAVYIVNFDPYGSCDIFYRNQVELDSRLYSLSTWRPKAI